VFEIGMTTDIGPNGLPTFFAGAQRFVSLATPEETRTAGQQGLSVALSGSGRSRREPPERRAADPAHATLLESVEPEYALRNAQARFAIPS
jgi:hypothetical protein